MTTENKTVPQNITINGVSYSAEQLPPHVQKMLIVYRKWELELNEQRLDAAKTEAAVRQLSREISEEMTPRADEAADPVAVSDK